MQENIKRLFFGVEVYSPWPIQLPKGRLLDEQHRHLTLAFLGNIPYLPLKEHLLEFPHFSSKVGSVGYFDACLTLPPRHPNVVAWHAHWLQKEEPLVLFQKRLSDWLISKGYSLDKRPWNAHVTLCRQPFEADQWNKDFIPLPFYTTSVHLYESVGNLSYLPIWSYPIAAPFEEISHTADMAFIIRGENLQQIYQHALIALAFKAPEFLDFIEPVEEFNHLDDVIIELNALVSKVDRAVGCPLKAVSFHGELTEIENALMAWEMIVDV